MAKKIMIISASPRKDGNTNTVVNWFAESARDNRAQVEIVDAAALEYKANGCTECMGCQKSDKYGCVIDDEASKVIDRMGQFDILVLATPIFWFGPAAQLKLLLDRTFALVKFDPKTGEPIGDAFSIETLVLIATAGGGLDAGLKLVDQTYRTAAGLMKWNYESLLVPFAPKDSANLAKNAELREQTADFAQRLATT